MIHCHTVTASKWFTLSVSQFLHLQTLFGNLLMKQTTILENHFNSPNLILEKQPNAVTFFFCCLFKLAFPSNLTESQVPSKQNAKVSTLQQRCSRLHIYCIIALSCQAVSSKLHTDTAWFSCFAVACFTLEVMSSYSFFCSSNVYSYKTRAFPTSNLPFFSCLIVTSDSQGKGNPLHICVRFSITSWLTIPSSLSRTTLSYGPLSPSGPSLDSVHVFRGCLHKVTVEPPTIGTNKTVLPAVRPTSPWAASSSYYIKLWFTATSQVTNHFFNQNFLYPKQKPSKNHSKNFWGQTQNRDTKVRLISMQLARSSFGLSWELIERLQLRYLSIPHMVCQAILSARKTQVWKRIRADRNRGQRPLFLL